MVAVVCERPGGEVAAPPGGPFGSREVVSRRPDPLETLMTSSGKVRIYELSRDLGLDNKDVLDAAEKLSSENRWLRKVPGTSIDYLVDCLWCVVCSFD